MVQLLPKDMELEREEEITRVQYIKYERKDTIVRKIIEQKKGKSYIQNIRQEKEKNSKTKK